VAVSAIKRSLFAAKNQQDAKQIAVGPFFVGRHDV
jgi:hypothetical protein